MSHSLTITISDDAYRALETVASANSTSPEKWVTSLLDRRLADSVDDPAAFEQRYEQYFGSVASGQPTSADNDQIDADLARSYSGDVIGS